jgi:hypothetical protein
MLVQCIITILIFGSRDFPFFWSFEVDLYYCGQLEQATTKANPGLTDLKVPVWQQLAVQMLVNGHPKAFIGNQMCVFLHVFFDCF